jgi:rfaE bifunctional protein kinase chain/domain
MDQDRLDILLDRLPAVRVLVVGDFFLDKYLVIDHQLAEVSLETGLEAHQVVEMRTSPGAAGTVASNLRALDVGVVALSIIGDDGQAYELLQGLVARGVDIGPLLQRPDRFTPTYTKPMLREADGQEHELQRLDIKNRTPLPEAVEQTLIVRLREIVPHVDGVVISDQVPERNCGVITDHVRDEIAVLARTHPQQVFIADSRERIGLFREVVVKPNLREASQAVGVAEEGPSTSLTRAEACAAELSRRTRRPAFVTLSAEGILVCTGETCWHVPAVPVSSPIDVVGAGDSVMAGIVTALCAGAEPEEAALIGNLVASITIQQIGTTGTASRQQVRERFAEFTSQTRISRIDK